MDRFNFVATQEIDSSIRRGTPAATRKMNTFSAHVYDEWVAARNAAFPDNPFPPLPKLPDVPTSLFNKVLSHFVFEIRRKDGHEYPPNTIHGIMCGIMRYLRDDCSRPDLNFFDKTHDQYHYLRQCIDSRMKELTQKGVGLHKIQAAPVLPEDEEKLWASGAFSMSSSDGLVAAVYFYVCKAFGLGSRDEHRQLTIDQFSFGEDNIGRYVKFTGENKNSGGLQHRSVSQKLIKHYDNPSSHSTYKIVNLYLDVLRQCDIFEGAFYRRPLMTVASKLRFSPVPIGVNTISKLLPDAAKKAGLSSRITGRSGKVSCATSLFNANVDEPLIKDRTGHRSSAVRAYKRPSAEQQKSISQILDYEPEEKTIAPAVSCETSIKEKDSAPLADNFIRGSDETSIKKEDGIPVLDDFIQRTDETSIKVEDDVTLADDFIQRSDGTSIKVENDGSNFILRSDE